MSDGIKKFSNSRERYRTPAESAIVVTEVAFGEGRSWYTVRRKNGEYLYHVPGPSGIPKGEGATVLYVDSAEGQRYNPQLIDQYPASNLGEEFADGSDDVVDVDDPDPPPPPPPPPDPPTPPVPPEADLATVMTDDPDPVLPGQVVVYSITVTNNGPNLATGVTLVITLPDDVTYVDAQTMQGSCSHLDGVVTCSIGSLGNGGSEWASLVVTAPFKDGQIEMSATASANEADANSNDNTSVEPTIVSGRGYGMGGFNPGYGYLTLIDGIEFGTGSLVSVASTLLVPRGYAAGVNSATRGYDMGGAGPSGLDSIEALQFVGETISGIAATLSCYDLRNPAAVNSAIRGYIMGGRKPAGPCAADIGGLYYIDSIEGIQFDDESWFNSIATLSANSGGIISPDDKKRAPATGVNSATHGYAMGGTVFGGYWGGSYYGEGEFYVKDIDGIEFEIETAVNPSAELSMARKASAGFNSSDRGYVLGGRRWSHPSQFEYQIGNAQYVNTYMNSPEVGSFLNVDTIDGIQFDDESAIIVANVLPIAHVASSGVNGHTYGFALGGSSGLSTNIYGLEFASEAIVNPGATLVQFRYGIAGVNYGGNP